MQPIATLSIAKSLITTSKETAQWPEQAEELAEGATEKEYIFNNNHNYHKHNNYIMIDGRMLDAMPIPNPNGR
jgi:hypothetical protein